MSKAFTSEETPDLGRPLARALLGREEGDAVEVVKPGGRTELTVVAVRRAPP